MITVILFLVVFFVTQGFLLIEEETLIILASVFWLDAAGSFIREYLTSEFENKGNIIKDKFNWYLQAKKALVELLILKHKDRQDISNDLISLYNEFVGSIVETNLVNYLKDLKVINSYEIKEDLVLTGLIVINDSLLNEIKRLLLIVEDKNVGNKDWFTKNKPI